MLHHALLEAAQHFGWRLPEVIAGYPRADTSFPVPYPTACSPQAWAAAAPVLTLQSVLGLRPDPATRTLRVVPDVPAGLFELRLTGVPAFGRLWDVEVATAAPASWRSPRRRRESRRRRDRDRDGGGWRRAAGGRRRDDSPSRGQASVVGPSAGSSPASSR